MKKLFLLILTLFISSLNSDMRMLDEEPIMTRWNASMITSGWPELYSVIHPKKYHSSVKLTLNIEFENITPLIPVRDISVSRKKFPQKPLEFKTVEFVQDGDSFEFYLYDLYPKERIVLRVTHGAEKESQIVEISSTLQAGEFWGHNTYLF